MKKSDWEDYMEIESDGSFPLLQARLDEECRIEELDEINRMQESIEDDMFWNDLDHLERWHNETDGIEKNQNMSRISMKLIGRGTFTRVYQKSQTRVFLKSVDPVKECMSLGFFPNSRLFPKIDRIDTEEYEMRYYEKVSSLKKSLVPKHYQIYQALRKIDACYTSGYEDLYHHFSRIENRRLRKAMIGAIDALAGYGEDIGFEISPRNVAVTPTGKLILLDCFFMISALDKARSK